jgi:integrase/recombinase XerD
MKPTKYERKQQLTQLRKDSLKKYHRDEILQKYQLEKNNGKGKHIITQDNTIISTLAMHVDKPFKEMENGNILNYHGKPYSPYTIEQHKVQVCKFFKFLYNWESWMPKPEAIRHININLNRAHKIKDLSQMPDLHDLDKLFETCELGKTPFIVIRDKALICAFYSGARLEEIHNLKINDVIQKDGVIYFTLDGKTGKRAVPINKYMQHLKRYLEVHPQRNNLSHQVQQVEKLEHLIHTHHQQQTLMVTKSGINGIGEMK